MKRLLLGVMLALPAAGALTAQPAAAQPYPPLPPPRYEPVPPPPGGRYVWENGHWQWNGVQYVWVPGRYVVRRPGWGRYAPGHWAVRHGRWVWVPAHWR